MTGRIKSPFGSTKYLSMSAMAFAVAVCFVCLGSCSKSDDPTPAPSPVNKDTKSPAITVKSLTFNVYGGKTVIVEAGRLTIGGTEAATWTDDKSAADKCMTSLSFTGPGTGAAAEVKSGDTLDKAGTLKLTVTDEAGNAASKSITLTAPNGAPVITVIKNGFNVYGGKTVTVEANVLKIGGEEAASWTDDHDADCAVALFFRERDAITGYYIAGAGIEIKSGDPIDKAGILMITVTDEAGNKAEKSITLTAQGLFGMANLKNLNLEVDREVNLMDGITTAEGWSIAKVEVETVGGTNGGSGTEGSRTEVPAPYKYTPTETGTIRIVITITDGSGRTAEFTSDELTVKPISYNAVIPAKAESMYQKFNTTNDRAFERWGAYETKALAQSLKNRNACNVLIYAEGVYTGDNSIYERIGGNGDGHGEEVYRNINEGSGTIKNILATKSTRIDVENNINNSSLKDQPIIITTSKEVLGQETLEELLKNDEYKAFKNLGNNPNILIYAASCNTKKGRNYALHESITDKSKFPNGLYEQESATDTDNGIIAVEYGISKNISKHGVYEGNHKTTSSAFISKDYHIIPRNVVQLTHNSTKNDSEERTKNNTSFAAPAAAAMARNVYDICYSLGIVKHLQDVRFLMEKYANPIPSTREDIAPDGTIIEDVPNGYVYTMNLLALIDNEIFPAIEKKCTSVNGECTVLYTYDGLRLAYQGAGVEYQDNNGIWRDSNGINPKDYVDRPQRINYALRSKYGNKGNITIYCMVPDGVLDYGDRKGGYIVKKENADIPTG